MNCKKGHELTPENTRVERGRYQTCRKCLNESRRKNYVANKQRDAELLERVKVRR